MYLDLGAASYSHEEISGCLAQIELNNPTHLELRGPFYRLLKASGHAALESRESVPNPGSASLTKDREKSEEPASGIDALVVSR
jgi:hypothetical protein